VCDLTISHAGFAAKTIGVALEGESVVVETVLLEREPVSADTPS
jgi:hypothetical protein